MPPALVTRPACEVRAATMRAEGVAPLLARALSAREDVHCKADIAPPLHQLPKPSELPGMPALARALADAMEAHEPVCVVGDYDADGVSAAALAFSALRKMGGDASWIIPERTDGYGLSPEIAERAAEHARTLLTVDNGASAAAGVRRARELGMTVCVTDHHLPSHPHPSDSENEAPHAHCMTNPKASLHPWPAPNLAGVGVAFYAMAALRAELVSRKQLKSPPNLAEFLDLVALGSIADCVPMDAVNRSLTAQGLARVRSGLCRPGLRAVLAAAGRPAAQVGARDIGRLIAPRVNAAGRLNNVAVAMECLLCENESDAFAAAAKLEEMNAERVRILKAASDEAAARVSDPPPDGIVLHDPQWHPGVVGIVAARLGDLFHRPAIVFASDGDGGELKGSGRAVNGFDLHAALSQMRGECPGLFDFGGHASAVGVKIGLQNLSAFAAMFAAACAGANKNGADEVEVDESPSPDEITLQAARQINAVAWGEQFPAPRFAGEFSVLNERALRGGHTALTLEADGRRFPAVRFFADPSGESRMTAVYGVGINYLSNGAQLIVERTL